MAATDNTNLFTTSSLVLVNVRCSISRLTAVTIE